MARGVSRTFCKLNYLVCYSTIRAGCFVKGTSIGVFTAYKMSFLHKLATIMTLTSFVLSVTKTMRSCGTWYLCKFNHANKSTYFK